jgi:hypothetical protein
VSEGDVQDRAAALCNAPADASAEVIAQVGAEVGAGVIAGVIAGVSAGMSAEVIDVLVPTCNRPAALAVTLTALGAQTWPALRIVVADQSDGAGADTGAEVQAVLRYLRATGRNVDFCRRLPRRGLAEQRDFLLGQVRSPYCLFVGDDVILEPDLVARLHAAIRAEGCGFVGSALHGLSFVGQRRPLQEAIEFWDGPVTPETVRPGSPAWTRHHLHSAANLFHVQADLKDGAAAGGGGSARPDRRYKVAWVGGCVLFDTAKLRAAGGFDFWHQLPAQHCGEDALAQQRVMARYGGCAILPSGAYHMELPTTVTARAIDAPYVLPLEVGPDVTSDVPPSLQSDAPFEALAKAEARVTAAEAAAAVAGPDDGAADEVVLQSDACTMSAGMPVPPLVYPAGHAGADADGPAMRTDQE